MKEFTKGLKAEWKKIVWPKGSEVRWIAGTCVAVTALTALLTTGIDAGMMQVLKLLMGA